MKSKLEIRLLLPPFEDNPKNGSALIPIDSLKTIDLSSYSIAERANFKFVVCEVTINSLKTREEPYFQTNVFSYGQYDTFEIALKYYLHKLNGSPLEL